MVSLLFAFPTTTIIKGTLEKTHPCSSCGRPKNRCMAQLRSPATGPRRRHWLSSGSHRPSQKPKLPRHLYRCLAQEPYLWNSPRGCQIQPAFPAVPDWSGKHLEWTRIVPSARKILMTKTGEQGRCSIHVKEHESMTNNAIKSDLDKTTQRKQTLTLCEWKPTLC